MSRLSTEQQNVVSAITTAKDNGVWIVDSVAGSGKTTVLYECADILHGMGRSVLYLAFNNSMASDACQRSHDKWAAHTLHAFVWAAVQRSWPSTKVSPKLCPHQADSAIAAATGGKQDLRRQVSDLLTYARSNGLHTIQEDTLPGVDVRIRQLTQQVIEDIYADATERGCFDFDGIIHYATRHDLAFPVYDWLLVDEIQDLNVAQQLIIIGIIQRQHRTMQGIVFVGDSNQAIYGFRHVSSDAVEHLGKLLQTRVQTHAIHKLQLNVCHRCPCTTVKLAQQLVPHIVPAASAPVGQNINAFCVRSYRQFWRWYCNDNNNNNMAVILRTNKQIINLLLAAFTMSTAIHVRWASNGLRDMLCSVLSEALQCNVSEMCNTLLNDNTLEIRLNCIEKLSVSSEYGIRLIGRTAASVPIDEFNNFLIFILNTLVGHKVPPSVCVTTVHSCKGLTFDATVILMDMYRHPHGGEDERDMRNLFYVALTRGRRDVIFVYTRPQRALKTADDWFSLLHA